MNSVTLMGRIGQEPEIKYMQSGQALVNLSLATNEVWTKDGQRQEKTEWHKLVLWGKTAEIASKYVHKGDQLLVTGRLQTRQWVDRETNGKRYITEVVVLRLELLGGRRAEAPAPEPGSDIPDENIPF